MTQRFNRGDIVTLPGALGEFTIKSWPENNDGRFVAEQYHEDGTDAVRRTEEYHEDEDGNVHPSSTVPVLVEAAPAPVLNTEETLADPVKGEEPLPIEVPEAAAE